MTLAAPTTAASQPAQRSATRLQLVANTPRTANVAPWDRTAATLREILTQDVRCRRRWQRHAHRIGAQGLSQAGVAMVLALELWDSGDTPESHHALPRSLKDRVSRALSGRLISGRTLVLFVRAFDLSEEQESRLYAAWELDSAHLPRPRA